MYEYCVSQKGKYYDKKFQWNDDKIYCSELVWKAYEVIGIELSEKKTFSDFQIDKPEIQKTIKERYGDKFIESEPVVSPQCLVESKYLYEIFSNFNLKKYKTFKDTMLETWISYTLIQIV